MKDNLAYIEHILDAIARIKRYTENLSYKEFERSEMIQDAVIRNFEVIGEATKNIYSELVLSNPKIPWKEMAGMRDKLIHDYMGVEISVIWKTTKEDIPELERLLTSTFFPKD